MRYNNMNDAARDVIDYLVEVSELSPSDYPYSSDITESLNQIASILSPNTEPASTIADAFANVMDAAVINGSAGQVVTGGK